MPMEIEAKFRVDDDQTFPALLQLDALGPFRLAAAAEPEDQRNVYFDTPDWRLRAAKAGLRVRTIGARRVATLKGAATVADGLYERDEWEAEVGPSDDPATWPAGELRDRALALTNGEPLAATLSIRTLRKHIYAERAGARVAELSLDEGDISAGGLAEHFRELEIELLSGGTRADLDELVALLRARFALQPEGQSKQARGLALLDRKPAAVAALYPSWIEIPVLDLARALSFYRAVFGLTDTPIYDEPGMQIAVLLGSQKSVRQPGVSLVCSAEHRPSPDGVRVNFHVGAHAALAAALERAAAHGGSLAGPIVNQDDGVRYATLRDSEGNAIAVSSYQEESS